MQSIEQITIKLITSRNVFTWIFVYVTWYKCKKRKMWMWWHSNAMVFFHQNRLFYEWICHTDPQKCDSWCCLFTNVPMHVYLCMCRTYECRQCMHATIHVIYQHHYRMQCILLATKAIQFIIIRIRQNIQMPHIVFFFLKQQH